MSEMKEITECKLFPVKQSANSSLLIVLISLVNVEENKMNY